MRKALDVHVCLVLHRGGHIHGDKFSYVLFFMTRVYSCVVSLVC